MWLDIDIHETYKDMYMISCLDRVGLATFHLLNAYALPNRWIYTKYIWLVYVPIHRVFTWCVRFSPMLILRYILILASYVQNISLAISCIDMTCMDIDIHATYKDMYMISISWPCGSWGYIHLMNAYVLRWVYAKYIFIWLVYIYWYIE
jgi:hypothetical protein